MAMLGDAGDETLMLIRSWDAEQFDVTKINWALADYHTRINALFKEGLCLNTGLTATMLGVLRTKPMLISVAGELKELGRVTDDIISKCLGRMAAWCKLADEISKAEFPSYEILRALFPFDLETYKDHGTSAMDAPAVKAAFARLSSVLKLNEKQSFDEYCHYLPLAIQHWRALQNNFEVRLHLGFPFNYSVGCHPC